jgi:hypothetical protein
MVTSLQRSKEARDAAAERPWLPVLWIIAASALAHLWCLGSQFYMDDLSGLVDNDAIRAGRFWGTPALCWTSLGYVVQYRLFGMSPVAFHAVNWLLHTSVACVLFGFGRDFLRGRWPAGVALLGALLFAVHPLASEIPNYARTQDLAWVTLFSLLASWALLRFLRDGGWRKLCWCGLAIVGATLSKGPGLFHALMMTGAIGLAFMTPAHWRMLRRRAWWVAGVILLGVAALWLSGIISDLWRATRHWVEPRFIGHAYTLGRVFWEFAWRSVIPVALCSDHHIAETLVPHGAKFWNIPDTGAIRAAMAMLVLTVFSGLLAWRKSTRLIGVCLVLYITTILFRVLYLIPEFMPEYRIYPGLPWFCLGAAILLGAGWRAVPGGPSPRIPAVLLVLLFAGLSAQRSFVWHDLDRLTSDILQQYPAQGRAVWGLHDRNLAAGEWQKVIARQRQVWPQVFTAFMAENRRLAPRRELPTGHFALADVACAGRYAIALAHVVGPAAGMAEIRRLERYMRRLRMDPVAHRLHWEYFFQSKVLVLEQAGNYQAACDLIEREKPGPLRKADIARVQGKLAAQAAAPP